MIVYSTCTTTVEENEGVITWLLEKHPGEVTVEPFDIPGVPFALALMHDAKGRAFPLAVTHTRRVLRSEAMEGFFVAKLRKVEESGEVWHDQ